MTVPSSLLHQAIGIAEARFTAQTRHVAVIDDPLA
jgi:hypothetical protein